MQTQRKNEIDFLTDTLLQSGDILLRFFGNASIDIKEKSPGNPVSEADFAADQFIKKQIGNYFPNDAILSEEAQSESERRFQDARRKNANRVWIIDPLDGTKNFLKGEPEFSVSIGLLENKKSVLGGVYNPLKKHLLVGGPESGLLLNQTMMKNTPQKKKRFAKFKLLFSKTELDQNLFSDIFLNNSKIQWQAIGSVAWKLSLTAAGECDLMLSRKPKSEWDVAGAMALLRARDFLLLDQTFTPITLNNASTKINGVIAGSAHAINEYKEELAKINTNPSM